MSVLRTAAINLVLPFINGLMLGFGELFAHEVAFWLGWSGTRVCLTLKHRPLPPPKLVFYYYSRRGLVVAGRVEGGGGRGG